MTEAEVRAAIFRALAGVAPEVEPDTIDPKASLRDQIDIDSMDFLNFVIAISKQLSVAIPEADYGKVTTLAKCAGYVTRLKAAPAPH